ncbi:MAG: hypothetical protein ACYC0O_13760 [Desulfurivibrionaceae bacterium]|jgi:hypothetical protein|nr:hypothetical protein [Pseudomonadota bacterium]MCG2822543.1 hypothetical protein [Desulfobulbaceae bacterium]MDP2002093.1 hypothetical protein [Desulfurivibrionaceae bacterium]MBU4229876.1 hypothetical protein [Pseudomonadota bacterium]MBU4407835.1 hypothetical protein [Pseudomonadota bacterium]
MQVICCVCHKTKNHKGWAKQAARSGVRLSHGYCPRCYRQMMEMVDNFFVLNGCRKSA